MAKSLFERLKERRKALDAGNPTGGDSFGDRGGNREEVEKALGADKKKKSKKKKAKSKK